MTEANFRCEQPNVITTAHGPRFIPCGDCRTCLRKVVMMRTGLAVMEQVRPWYRHHLDPNMQHKLDLTYEKEPMTVPVPHRLGVVFDEATGKEKLWAGHPWDGQKRGVFKKNGRLVYAESRESEDYEYLTEDQCAEEFDLVYRNRYKWTSRDIQRYETGDYDPRPTPRYRDIELFLKRVRTELDREHGIQKMRHIAATEVGDLNFRPHGHICLLGVPVGAVPDLYALWTDYAPTGEGAGIPGFVYPFWEDALKGATVIYGNAGPYALKDIAKSPYLYNRTPEMLGVERPKVRYSTSPPIGERYRHKWTRDQLLPGYIQALDGGADPADAVTELRKKALRVRVQLWNKKWEEYPTAPRWRNLVRTDFEIPPELWAESTNRMRASESEFLSEVLTDEKASQEFKESQERLAERSREISEQRAQRRDRKRSRLVAAGKFRSKQS